MILPIFAICITEIVKKGFTLIEILIKNIN
ncbi:prepilin-type N-terminal cleavage/methylation domain-containing protein (plasmid) [Clostridium butyricum]|nr:prepilin-type N-terminal cleavage/methylation domain-containing protein [Clostridium butyricum]QGH24729.1 prepilin-type N-terminal cleavage/methylation domain-containing protein [Clostridium butyricum]